MGFALENDLRASPSSRTTKAMIAEHEGEAISRPRHTRRETNTGEAAGQLA